MKVYILTREGSEWTDIVGVFSYRVEAERVAKWHKSRPKAHWLNPLSKFVITLHEVREPKNARA